MRILRSHHRLALPVLAPSFARLRLSAKVAICSSSGWAHGAQVDGRKIVYCHTPARWLYQPERYLRGRGRAVRAVAGLLHPWLRRWDRAAAASADRYLANSSAVAERIKSLYGIEAEVVAPPPAMAPDGPVRPLGGLEPGFLLCVSRLLPYKNVDAIVQAAAELTSERLVVAGGGPEEATLRRLAASNVTFTGEVGDHELRWLYANCRLLVAASYEDFGLTPLEAAAFGKPSATLRWGGFLDTVTEGETGVFFETPIPQAVASAIQESLGRSWDVGAIRAHAERFSERRFIDRMQKIAEEESVRSRVGR
jgi:glycosyltransferase involved in cell wall biosynthesis